MATDSKRAAQLAFDEQIWRSCVSRSYYAGYQSLSALLIYAGETPPEAREAWNHADTPDMLRSNSRLISWNIKRPQLIQLAGDLRILYRMRVSADYISKDLVLDSHAAFAKKASGNMVKLTESFLRTEG